MPGLLRGVARTAVIAGTASAVSGRVQHRQQGRWAEQEARSAQAAAPPPPLPAPMPVAPPAAPPPAALSQDALIAQLRDLADLRDQGILTDAEFAAQKARLLGS